MIKHSLIFFSLFLDISGVDFRIGQGLLGSFTRPVYLDSFARNNSFVGHRRSVEPLFGSVRFSKLGN